MLLPHGVYQHTADAVTSMFFDFTLRPGSREERFNAADVPGPEAGVPRFLRIPHRTAVKSRLLRSWLTKSGKDPGVKVKRRWLGVTT